MLGYNHGHLRDSKMSLSSHSSNNSFKGMWNRLSHIFQHEQPNRKSASTNSTTSTESSIDSSRPRVRRRRHVYSNERNSSPSKMIIPPYSPTYCRPNEFPYSNFYVKLPNGNWMIRYRSGNRDILGTDEFEGYLI
jgi:hypothetical protein